MPVNITGKWHLVRSNPGSTAITATAAAVTENFASLENRRNNTILGKRFLTKRGLR